MLEEEKKAGAVRKERREAGADPRRVRATRKNGEGARLENAVIKKNRTAPLQGGKGYNVKGDASPGLRMSHREY